MIYKELTFQPEVERNRDLTYSEYASRERSIHVLLQEQPGVPVRFLLDSYREIVSQYLSVTRLSSPERLLESLAISVEGIGERAGVTASEFQETRFYVVLRTPGAIYLMLSRDDGVFVHAGGEVVPISTPGLPGVSQGRLGSDEIQNELFSERLRDAFKVYKLNPILFGTRDIILGCGEEEVSTVVEVLEEGALLDDVVHRDTVTSRFITRKLLVLRFLESTHAHDTTELIGARTWPKREGWGRRIAWVGTSVVVLVAAGMWAVDFMNGDDLPNLVSRETAVTPQSVVDEPESQRAVEHSNTGAPSEALAEVQLSEGWRESYSEGVTSSPALYSDWVVFGCRDGSVYALDQETGGLVWRYQTAAGVGASPVIHGESIIGADYEGNVFALSATTGKSRWNRKLPGRIVSSPSVSGGNIVVGCYDGYAYCLNAVNGTISWKHKTGGRIRGGTSAADGKFFVPSYDGYLYALEVTTGDVAWRHRVGGKIAGATAVRGGTVVVGGVDGVIYALSTEDGSLRWKYKTGAPVKSAPTIRSGRVFIGSNDRYLYCLNLADGDLKWRFQTGGLVLARPRVHEGRVYAGSYDGKLYCLEADTGKVVDRFDTGGPIFSSPVAGKNSVYLGNNKGTFICVDHNKKRRAS